MLTSKPKSRWVAAVTAITTEAMLQRKFYANLTPLLCIPQFIETIALSHFDTLGIWNYNLQFQNCFSFVQHLANSNKNYHYLLMDHTSISYPL